MDVENSVNHLRPTQEYPEGWLRYIGYARVGILLLLIVGAASILGPSEMGFLVFLCVAGLAMTLWYVGASYRSPSVGLRQTWAQILTDFIIVAAIVFYTGGPSSHFTFIFVLVVLEVVLLLGLTQGFLFAGLASAFMLGQTVFLASVQEETANVSELWYEVVGNALAFFLTAFISGYWNQSIRRLQEFQRDILDNMNAGFLITDEHGVLRLLNDAGRKILTLSGSESIGRHVSETLKVDSGAECPVVTALRSERDFTSYEFRALTGEGRTRLLGLTTNLMREDGKLTGLIASFTDLTEMDELRRDVRQQDRMAAIGELAAGLSHEIRNPVAVIRGALDEMGTVSTQDALTEKLRTIAIQESDHLTEIVSGFLDFAREPTLKREIFDVREVLQEVIGLLEREYAVPGEIEISASFAAGPCNTSGDRSQIKQVFVNLAKNAVEAMSGRGHLWLTVSNGNGPIEIRMEDDGSGISPDEVERVFEPFYTTKETGVGMGLAVCSRILTAHDGVIRASSREGGGCAMVVRLPAARNED